MKTARRIDMTPIRIGRTWLFADGTRLPVVCGGDGDDGAPPIVPDNLSDREAFPDADLDALEDEIVAEFDKNLDEGSTDVAVMTELAEALEKVRAEKAARSEADNADAEAIEALRNRVHATDAPAEGDEDGDEGGDGGDEKPADDGDDGEGAAAEPEGSKDKEPVAASGAPKPLARRPASASGTSRRSARPNVNDAQPRIVITAAADLPGVSTGSTIDLTQVALSLHDKARALSNGSARVPVAQFNMPYGKDRTIGKQTSAEAAQVILDRVSDQSILDLTNLTAAGGWCTPSQNSYDLFALDGATGLLDLPSVGIERGGLNFPGYIGLDAADGALWSWSEDLDAQGVLAISDLDVAAGVGSVVSSAHHLQPGDLVVINTNTAADGPRTVVTTADNTHFTFDATGVPNLTNATGTATAQKACFSIPCPEWSDVRLGAYGLCINHGNLTDRAFPELTRRYVQLVMNAHLHRMSAVNVAKIAASTNSVHVTMGAGTSDVFGELMSAIELQTADYRSEHSISDNVVIEVLLPTWTNEIIRTNLAARAGVDDMLSVTDAQIAAAFAARNTRPQFIQDYLPLWNGTPRTAWPTATEFLMYPAGSIVEGNGGTIDLGVLRDSRLNATNDFTAAWTEDFRLIARRGPLGRRVSVTLGAPDGVTACCP